jgi:hypothetical protein
MVKRRKIKPKKRRGKAKRREKLVHWKFRFERDDYIQIQMRIVDSEKHPGQYEVQYYSQDFQRYGTSGRYTTLADAISTARFDAKSWLNE